MSGKQVSTGHFDPSERVLRNREDATSALRELMGPRSISTLIREHGDITRSVGAWSQWRGGKRIPTLGRFIELVQCFGGEVVVRSRGRE